jgi:hypothetical protein
MYFAIFKYYFINIKRLIDLAEEQYRLLVILFLRRPFRVNSNAEVGRETRNTSVSQLLVLVRDDTADWWRLGSLCIGESKKGNKLKLHQSWIRLSL